MCQQTSEKKFKKPGNIGQFKISFAALHKSGIEKAITEAALPFYPLNCIILIMKSRYFS